MLCLCCYSFFDAGSERRTSSRAFALHVKHLAPTEYSTGKERISPKHRVSPQMSQTRAFEGLSTGAHTRVCVCAPQLSAEQLSLPSPAPFSNNFHISRKDFRFWQKPDVIDIIMCVWNKWNNNIVSTKASATSAEQRNEKMREKNELTVTDFYFSTTRGFSRVFPLLYVFTMYTYFRMCRCLEWL